MTATLSPCDPDTRPTLPTWQTPTLAPMVKGYLTESLWSERGSGSIDHWEEKSHHDFSSEAVQTITTDCHTFLEHARRRSIRVEVVLAVGAINMECVGHDFWLTRNGHGAGFWDREDAYYVHPEIRDTFNEVAKTFPEQWIYVGDDGKVHVS